VGLLIQISALSVVCAARYPHSREERDMTTGLDVFDASVQETNLWLKDIMERLGTGDRRIAYRALRGTLHAVRDRIGPQNATHLAAQLPMLIRGLYFEGWHITGTPTKERHKQAFLEHANTEFRGGIGIDPEKAVRAVLDVMWKRLDPGETAKLVELLPRELRELWPASMH
jgi:uncharacterized protein (DUF2267 family)